MRLIFAIVLLSTLSSCDSPVDVVPATTFSIEGYILPYRDCEKIVTLNGFTVELTGSKLKTVTDDSGSYRFPAIQPGRYSIRFSKEGYWPSNSELEVYPNGEYTAPYSYIYGKADLEARYVGDWLSTEQTRTITVDSFYTNAWGELVQTSVRRIVLDTIISIGVEAYQAGIRSDNLTLQSIMNLNSEFDYFDDAEHVLAYSDSPILKYSLYALRARGVRSGDTIHSRVWAVGQCLNGSYRVGGTSALKPFIMP
jgi:hypothetical protein